MSTTRSDTMPLKEYRTHVENSNQQNDAEIRQLQIEKVELTGPERKEHAKKIARIMREKTTRQRRLSEKEKNW